jgi:hypothetical protein
VPVGIKRDRVVMWLLGLRGRELRRGGDGRATAMGTVHA